MGIRNKKRAEKTTSETSTAFIVSRNPDNYEPKRVWDSIEQKLAQYLENRDWLEAEIMKETQSPEPNIERLAMLKHVVQALKMNGDSQQALIDKARDYQFWGNKGNLDDEIQRERIKLIAKLDEQIENG